ncbi:DUF1566 domain-containing protein [bacterium]|nr:DUF1566 domain-containing protein [bacterium]
MKQTLSILTAVFAVLAFFVSCGGSGSSEPGSIYGVVTDKATGEPVINAGVELQPIGLKTVTGSDGQFEFNEVAAGEYTLYVTKTGYSDNSSDITVKSGKQSKGDVQLEKASATLRIVDDAGNDISELDFGAEIADVSRQFNIFNDSPASLNWKITWTAEWIISLSEESGELKAGDTRGIIVGIDRTLLREGENLTKLHVTSNNGNKQLTIKATLNKGATKTSECTGLPENAEWNTVSEIEQSWDGEEWQPSAKGSYNEESSKTECRFKCKTNYTLKNSKCEADTQTANCTGLPANAHWNTASSITQTWNGSEWIPSTTGSYSETAGTNECKYKCVDNYHHENNQCVSNTKTEDCASKPANTDWNDGGAEGKFTQIWNGEEWIPASYASSYSETAGECRYKCTNSYHRDDNQCVSNTKTALCTGLPANAQWNTVSSITQTWSSTNGWQPSTIGVYSETASSNECKYKCDSTHYRYYSECTSPCDYEPCDEVANSTGCTATSWQDYSCECKNGYKWNGTKCVKKAFGSICTGQTGCFNASSSATTCQFSSTDDFYGQDAQYAALGYCLPQSFTIDDTVASEKTIIDNNTDLEWQQILSSAITWSNAKTYCENSNYGAHNDWRLPNPQELLSIVDNNRYASAVDTTYFPDMKSTGTAQVQVPFYYVWTSKSQYAVNMYDGSISSTQEENQHALCVRGNELPKGSFLKVNNDVVVDSVTGLMWQKTYGMNKKWQEALKYCEDLNYAGYSDWRLPNKNELASLENYSKLSSPYSDFPDMPSGRFWSSSLFYHYNGQAWLINFENIGMTGHLISEKTVNLYSNGNTVSYPIYVRCVR